MYRTEKKTYIRGYKTSLGLIETADGVKRAIRGKKEEQRSENRARRIYRFRGGS
jgi:hypothetical protein